MYKESVKLENVNLYFSCKPFKLVCISTSDFCDWIQEKNRAKCMFIYSFPLVQKEKQIQSVPIGN